MWLPKDERRLLRGYYRLLREVGRSRGYRESDLEKLLESHPKYDEIREYGKGESTAEPEGSFDLERARRAVTKAVAMDQRFHLANGHLEERGMIEIIRHQTEHDVIFVSLMLSGYDLGRKYAKSWDRTGLWFAEYRNHWIWLILGFLGGIIAALIIDLLKRGP